MESSAGHDPAPCPAGHPAPTPGGPLLPDQLTKLPVQAPLVGFMDKMMLNAPNNLMRMIILVWQIEKLRLREPLHSAWHTGCSVNTC